MVVRRGLACIGFVTVTFKENVTDRDEAQRRFNSLASHFLRPNLLEFIVAVERQRRGAIHYHLICAFPFDIRAGFNFEACGAANLAKKRGDVAEFKRWERVYFASANPALRDWWRRMREAAERYGFGRCETLPVLSNAEGVARYVGTYVRSESENREARDKGMRTLRYSLDRRAASSAWSWCAGGGRSWRMGCAVLAAILRCEDFSAVLGKRWAWDWRRQISVFGRHWSECMAQIVNIPDHYSFKERVVCVAGLTEVIEALEAAQPVCRAPGFQGGKPAVSPSSSFCINSTGTSSNEP
jgi:hypothetical protein